MSRSRTKRTILLTMGDPAGIGPEVAAAALREARLPPGTEVTVIGNADTWAGNLKPRQQRPAFVDVRAAAHIRHVPGCPTPSAGRDSLLYLHKAVDLLRSGQAQALVTGPVSKESVGHWVSGFRGHTTFLAEAFKQKNVEMLFIGPGVRMVLVTRHVPLRDLPRLVTKRKVVSVVAAAADFLRARCGVSCPRIAVLGLNPHAGEGGAMGREEIDEIIPAIRSLGRQGLDVHGPFPADTFFEPRNRTGYDLVVAMYHDQGLAALKTLYFDSLVNVTAGLPFVRTSPVHGTAFGIAGKGMASCGSMKAALELAAQLL